MCVEIGWQLCTSFHHSLVLCMLRSVIAKSLYVSIHENIWSEKWNSIQEGVLSNQLETQSGTHYSGLTSMRKCNCYTNSFTQSTDAENKHLAENSHAQYQQISHWHVLLSVKHCSPRIRSTRLTFLSWATELSIITITWWIPAHPVSSVMCLVIASMANKTFSHLAVVSE